MNFPPLCGGERPLLRMNFPALKGGVLDPTANKYENEKKIYLFSLFGFFMA
jgi:hypothetical protein